MEDGSPNLPINVFDLSGFPHWETVSSNIWAYFINPNEQHGFGTLVLKSIMQAISGSTKCQIVNSTSHKLLKKNSFIYETVSVEREMQTTGANNVEDRSRRIDIDVDSDNFKLIIENKIDALPSYNNLVAYAQHGIKELYSDNQTKPLFIGFLCQSITHKPSLKEQFRKLCQEFSHKQNINNIYYFVITYDEVFDNIKKNGFSFKNSNSLDSRSSSLLKQFRENTSLAYKESLIVEDLPLIKNNSK
ncbi:PD-(D/E)XK nuclease family protein [Furfurilactobacillus milii]|uniref:PD-(D/E)XK nuclease family protein n=1 Tax=Furfurilactobacillus milii TaxID=2888272 RepID=UPI001EE2EF90|nr:PD-(D/E)XK nuclease family protein [Furfurilactobacillus milii]